jgi:hypothetical protein
LGEEALPEVLAAMPASHERHRTRLLRVLRSPAADRRYARFAGIKNIDEIRSFVHVVENASEAGLVSFQATARVLAKRKKQGMLRDGQATSDQSLSNHVKSLNKALGVELVVVRAQVPCEVTIAGRGILPLAKEYLLWLEFQSRT